MDVPVDIVDGIRVDAVVSGEASKEGHPERPRRDGGEGDLAEISYRGRLTRSRVRQSTDLQMGDRDDLLPAGLAAGVTETNAISDGGSTAEPERAGPPEATTGVDMNAAARSRWIAEADARSAAGRQMRIAAELEQTTCSATQSAPDRDVAYERPVAAERNRFDLDRRVAVGARAGEDVAQSRSELGFSRDDCRGLGGVEAPRRRAGSSSPGRGRWEGFGSRQSRPMSFERNSRVTRDPSTGEGQLRPMSAERFPLGDRPNRESDWDVDASLRGQPRHVRFSDQDWNSERGVGGVESGMSGAGRDGCYRSVREGRMNGSVGDHGRRRSPSPRHGLNNCRAWSDRLMAGRQDSPQDLGSRRPNMQPDRYDGTTPWLEYLAHFELCASINGWSNDECALYMAAKLKGQAQRVLGDGRCRRGYRELVELMTRSFGPGQHSEMYLAELRGRRRKPDESVQELGLEIRRLAELAYPEMEYEARDRLTRMHFRDALDNQEIRMALFQARPLSLEEAIEVATEFDAYLEVEKNRSGRSTGRARVMISQDEELVKLREELTRLRETVNSRPRRNRDMSEVTCYGCEEKGHYKRDCPNGRDNRSGNARASAPGIQDRR